MSANGNSEDNGPTRSAREDVAAPASGAQAGDERVDRHLLDILVCPLTKTSLSYDEARQELVSRKARLAFPIRRGVPHLSPSEARHLDD